MTRVIYFFLMSLSLFILPQLVVKVLNKQPKIDRNTMYLFFAGSLPLFWAMLPRELAHIREINFLQHAVGGGVAVGFVSIYLIQSLRENFKLLEKFPMQIIFVYGLVSMFGVANELLEFGLDVAKVGVFSSDRYDTWFDLVANTTGALTVFIIYKILKRDL